MAAQDSPSYLAPYERVLRQRGDCFEALLWTSPRTQAARFEALTRLYDFTGREVLDAGCGRADLLDYLVARRMAPALYVGLEAVPTFAAAARGPRPGAPRMQIVEADFVRQPQRLFVGAQAIVFCGSLNTLSSRQFEDSLAAALQAASEAVLANFLSSPLRAGADWLTWHCPTDILSLAERLGAQAQLLDGYIDGDCTVALRKKGRASSSHNHPEVLR